MTVLAKEYVEDFLKKFKHYARKKLYAEDYANWLQDLAELGIDRSERDKILFSLSAENYFRGPSQDLDRPGEVWEFGYNLEDNQIYIKLKLVEGTSSIFAKCIKFHKARELIPYPYRKVE